MKDTDLLTEEKLTEIMEDELVLKIMGKMHIDPKYSKN